MSPYTLPIALALIVIAAVAAWAVLREFSSMRKRLEAAESNATTLERIGQNVIGAVKPIELALKGAAVLASVKDKPSAALKKRRP